MREIVSKLDLLWSLEAAARGEVVVYYSIGTSPKHKLLNVKHWTKDCKLIYLDGLRTEESMPHRFFVGPKVSE